MNFFVFIQSCRAVYISAKRQKQPVVIPMNRKESVIYNHIQWKLVSEFSF